MNALEMTMAWESKKRKHLQVCLRCGHLNNKEEDVYKRICRCATPVLCNAKNIGNRTIAEMRQLPEYRHHFPNQ
ncbi:hypothetical protein LCGC14_0365820 [marine sediment metagenome]|uniref:Uncharacterized protein n=1 Tax=marine sediment metagenome TaxID=412755 RepID=A0A0F9T6U0_9ZZZZ